jgi:hypothetical protein
LRGLDPQPIAPQSLSSSPHDLPRVAKEGAGEEGVGVGGSHVEGACLQAPPEAPFYQNDGGATTEERENHRVLPIFNLKVVLCVVCRSPGSRFLRHVLLSEVDIEYAPRKSRPAGHHLRNHFGTEYSLEGRESDVYRLSLKP